MRYEVELQDGKSYLLSCPSTWLHSFFADFTTAEIGAAFFRSSFCAFHVFFLFFVL